MVLMLLFTVLVVLLKRTSLSLNEECSDSLGLTGEITV